MTHLNALKAAQATSRGFPEQFYKNFHPLVFVHSYPNLDNVLKGGDLIKRDSATCNGDALVMNSKGLKEGQYVFIGLPRMQGVAKALVEKIVDQKAYISGMGCEIEK